MNKFIVNTIKLLFAGCSIAFIIPFFVAISTHWTPKIENLTFGHITYFGNSYERSLDYRNWIKSPNRPKGLILGSSTAYRNINSQILTSETNINWFNLGSTGQSPNISIILFKDLLRKAHIDYLLFDLYSEIYDNSGQESAFDLINNSTFPLSIKLRLFFVKPDFKLSQRLIYRHLQATFGGRVFRFESKNNGTYLLGGSTYSPYIKSKTFHDNKLKLPQLKLNNDLKEIISICNKNKIKLILNIAPIIGKKSRFEIKSPNILINDDLNKKTEWFYDDHHMHGQGSIEYTRSIARKMFLSQLIN